MIEIQGKYGKAIVYTDNIDNAAYSQILNIPANMGLTYEFFRHDDIWDLACHLDQVYEKLHKGSKKKNHIVQ